MSCFPPLLLVTATSFSAGIDTLEDLSAEQLQAQAGGETLRACVTDLLGIAKNTKRSSMRLKVRREREGRPSVTAFLGERGRQTNTRTPPCPAA
jgi:hypothetical protein